MANITYVDQEDNVVGSGPVLEAHEKGIVHRVVRIYLYNADGNLLIQRRADHIGSNPGKWTESVAGHVDAGETYRQAAEREMKEELNISGVNLVELKKVYVEEKDAHKLKKRFTMLYNGTYDGEIQIDPGEVSQVRWIAPEDFRTEMKKHPEHFSEGSRLCFAHL
jgi:isopentenyldiphosphate isomerase